MDSVFLRTWFLSVYPQNQHHCSAEVLSFLMELTLPHPGGSLEPALQAPDSRQFQSSSFVFSLKRVSEMNPRSIFSLRTTAINKAMPKSNGLFFSRDITQFQENLDRKKQNQPFFPTQKDI